MSVRGEIIYIYESCPVAVLIFRFRQSVAFLKSRIRWEREYLYLPTYFSIRPISEQYCDYNNNDDELGLSRYLSVKSSINPSIHQTIFWIPKRHNTSLFKSLGSSRTRPDDKLTHTNERTNRARKQAKQSRAEQHVQHKKKTEKQRSTGRPFISEYSYSTKPKKKKPPKSPKKEKAATNQPTNQTTRTPPQLLKRKDKKK